MSPWARRTPSPRISVDRRLWLLVLCQLGTALVVFCTALVAMDRLARERAFMDRYVFAPLLDIGEALATADELHEIVTGAPASSAEQARGPLLRLRGFVDRYQRDWETGTSDLPEAARLRTELMQQGEMRLLSQEHEFVGECQTALHGLEVTVGLPGAAPVPAALRADVVALDRALGRLNLVNLRYVQIAYRAFDEAHQRVTSLFIAISLLGLAATAITGLFVRRAVGPRVRRMVESVTRFRDCGQVTPLDDRGDDDLGVLANTLDVSFKAIAERDQERHRFLAVAAHELKTPLTTLKGFAQTARAHRGDPAICERALAVIDRQATRLSHLVQDLLLAARAGAGKLPFRPAPLDLDALSRRVVTEIGQAYPERTFQMAATAGASLLGDAALLEHAVWNLLVQAATLAPDGEPVEVAIEQTPSRARLSVQARNAMSLPEDLDELVEPFEALPIERAASSPHSTGLGLHVVREIARLHRASLYLDRRAGGVLVSTLDLRR